MYNWMDAQLLGNWLCEVNASVCCLYNGQRIQAEVESWLGVSFRHYSPKLKLNKV